MTARGHGVWVRADTNRDGDIDEADEADKTEWTPSRGAIFLANIDDDGRRSVARAPDGRHLTDRLEGPVGADVSRASRRP